MTQLSRILYIVCGWACRSNRTYRSLRHPALSQIGAEDRHGDVIRCPSEIVGTIHHRAGHCTSLDGFTCCNNSM